MVEFSRYIRNLQLPGFSEKAQKNISDSSVLIIGAGALGSVAAMYLAASGVGRIAIADYDTIDLTNLQRQVFYSENELGESKAGVLAKKISALNSSIKVEVINKFITPSSALGILKDLDAILECSDNPSTKQMVVEQGRLQGIPVILGGVTEYSGQVMVFNSDSPLYTEVFSPPECSSVLPCGSAGVFGPVPGIVASIQASEALKLLGGIPESLNNTLLTFDVRDMSFHKYRF